MDAVSRGCQPRMLGMELSGQPLPKPGLLRLVGLLNVREKPLTRHRCSPSSPGSGRCTPTLGHWQQAAAGAPREAIVLPLPQACCG